MLPVYSQPAPTLQLPLPITQQLKAHGQAIDGPPSTFLGLLANGVSAVNHTQQQADQQVHELLTGGDVTQAEVLTAVQKADMAFRLLVQVRNKLLAAYEELNGIRV